MSQAILKYGFSDRIIRNGLFNGEFLNLKEQVQQNKDYSSSCKAEVAGSNPARGSIEASFHNIP